MLVYLFIGSDKACYYAGDGECDDESNTKQCNYDGGDCCLKNVITYYCLECECKDPTDNLQ